VCPHRRARPDMPCACRLGQTLCAPVQAAATHCARAAGPQARQASVCWRMCGGCVFTCESTCAHPRNYTHGNLHASTVCSAIQPLHMHDHLLFMLTTCVVQIVLCPLLMPLCCADHCVWATSRRTCSHTPYPTLRRRPYPTTTHRGEQALPPVAPAHTHHPTRPPTPTTPTPTVAAVAVVGREVAATLVAAAVIVVAVVAVLWVVAVAVALRCRCVVAVVAVVVVVRLGLVAYGVRWCSMWCTAAHPSGMARRRGCERRFRQRTAFGESGWGGVGCGAHSRWELGCDGTYSVQSLVTIKMPLSAAITSLHTPHVLFTSSARCLHCCGSQASFSSML
jgi:hypothetical protein